MEVSPEAAKSEEVKRARQLTFSPPELQGRRHGNSPTHPSKMPRHLPDGQYKDSHILRRPFISFSELRCLDA